MSKESWFRHYEQLQAEHPDECDDNLSEMARDREIDEMADQADLLVDQAKEADPQGATPRAEGLETPQEGNAGGVS